MVFTEKKINYEKSDDIVIKLFNTINKYIDDIDCDIELLHYSAEAVFN
jgi:hypothetical protein